MRNHDVKDRKYSELMDGHPILYSRRFLPMNQTCMCWGIDCGNGWYRPISDLSDQLESINLNEGRKWGIAIRAEQVKEKYGTLHFYHSTETLPSRFLCLLAYPFTFLADIFDKTSFKSEKIDLGNGKYRVVWHPRFRHFASILFRRISNGIKWCVKPSKNKTIVRNTIDLTVDKLIRQAEMECYNVCEDCGCEIGTKWSPRCETQGWIYYLCKECAKKHGGIYAIYDEEKNARYYYGDDDVTDDYIKKNQKKDEDK